jgi:hypothetical protein
MSDFESFLMGSEFFVPGSDEKPKTKKERHWR